MRKPVVSKSLTRPGRRFGGRRGILLPERELTFEIGNPFRLLGELFTKSFVLFFQSFDLLRLAITDVARLLLASRPVLALRLHQPERTKSLQKVQVQNQYTPRGPELLHRARRLHSVGLPFRFPPETSAKRDAPSAREPRWHPRGGRQCGKAGARLPGPGDCRTPEQPGLTRETGLNDPSRR